MRGDYLTYRRAAGVSFLGMAIQLAMALAMLIYGRLGDDHTAVSASIFMSIGLIVWLALAILYDQHRRERIEAMEAEALASEASASAFEQTDDLHVAARRVATFQRWALPVFSVVVAAALITAGYLRWNTGRELTDHDKFGEAGLPGWGIAVGLGVAFVGFVFARFVSGMGKQSSWAALRAGASQSVGAALLGLAIAVGHFVDLAIGPDFISMYLPASVGIFMIVVGAELAINFLLDLYRPRQPGQELRPAFDSRLLGLLAAPDKIAESVGEALSYQFGVDVTGSWFYRLLSRWILALVVIAIVIGWGLTMFVVVEPHQRALILTNGKISKPLMTIVGEQGERDVGPGLHLKLPWPFGQVLVPEFTTREAGGQRVLTRTTTGVRTLHLGANPPTDDGKPLLWTEEHSPNELLNIVQPSLVGLSVGDDAAPGVGGDVALVAVEVPAQFVVTDVERYERLAAPGEREDVLANVGRRVVMNYLSHMRIDQVLASQRTALADALKTELENAFAQLNDGEGAGIELVFVGLGGVHPPKLVAPNYEGLIQARQNYEAKLEDARTQEVAALTGIAGSVELSKQIVGQLRAVDRLAESGQATDEQIIERSLEVQRLLEQAGGEAGERLVEAGAIRWKRHMGERAKATLFAGQAAAYDAAPELYRAKAYFAALRDAMKDTRVFINTIEGARIRLQLEDQQGAITDLDFSTGQIEN